MLPHPHGSGPGAPADARLAALAAAVVLGVLGFALSRPGHVRFYADGTGLRVRAAEVQPRRVIWEEPTAVLPGGQVAGGGDFDPAIDPATGSLILARGRPKHDVDLFVAAPAAGGGWAWGEAVALEALNSPRSDELAAAPGPGGTFLVFASDRPGGEGGYDLWMAARVGGGPGASFAPPVNLGAGINSPYDEYDPAVEPGGGGLVFASNRPRRALTPAERNAWQGTLRGGLKGGDFDLYFAPLAAASAEGGAPDAEGGDGAASEGRRGELLTVKSAAAGQAPHPTGGGDDGAGPLPLPRPGRPARIDALNTGLDEGQAAFSPRGGFLYFSSSRPGGAGGFDLYRSARAGGAWGAPENLGAPVNSAADEMDPALHAEGFGLLFSSDRGGRETRSFALYQTVTREVRLEVVTAPPPLALPGRAAWALLLMAATLAGFLGLLRRFLDESWRRAYTLFQRCVLASVLAHLLLAFGFTLWVLEGVIRGRQGEAMEVAVGADNLAQERLALSIRDEVTEIPETSPEPLERTFSDAWEAPPEDAPSARDYTGREIDRTGPQVFALPVETPPDEAETDAPGEESLTAFDAAAALPPNPAELTPPPAIEIAADPPPAPEPERAPEPPPIDDAPAPDERVAHPPEPPEPAAPATPLPPPESLDTPPRLPEVTAVLGDIPAEESPAPHDLLQLAAGVIDPANALPPAPAPAPLLLVVDGGRHDAPPAQPEPDPEPEPPAPSAERTTAPGPPAQANVPDLPPAPAEPPPLPPAVADVGKLRAEIEALPPAPPPAFTGPDGGLQSELPRLEIGVTVVLEAPPAFDDPYLLRDPDTRRKVLNELRVTKESEEAVSRALTWFTRNQESDGRWSIQRHGGGRAGHDVAATSLALLCYFGWGADHLRPGEHQEPVARAIDWLIGQLGEKGDLRGVDAQGRRGDMYDQGMAGIALCEAFGLTGDPRLEEPAAAAIAFIVEAQGKNSGGWRYNPGDDNGDTSVFGWQVMALKSAELARLDTSAGSAEALEKSKKWLQRVGGGKEGGLYGYQNRSPKPAMVAEGMFCQQLLGLPPGDPRSAESAAYLARHLPGPKKQVDFYFWYYGAAACYQHQGQLWEDWSRAMQETLLPVQRREGKHAGSWDADGQWGGDGGRAVCTALATLSLEVAYRYLPIHTVGPR